MLLVVTSAKVCNTQSKLVRPFSRENEQKHVHERYQQTKKIKIRFLSTSMVNEP